jgi:hypothetical protein
MTFFSKNHAVHAITLKNMEEPEGTQMMSQHGEYDLHAGLARSHMRTPT